MKTEMIKKLHLKQGHKYILIIPDSAGLTQQDVSLIDSRFVEMSIMVKSARGMKVIEYSELTGELKK